MNRRQAMMGLAASGAMGSGAFALDKAGFHVPAEEAPHELTFMQWPVSRQVYDTPDWLIDIQATIANIANAIAAFEPVVMLAAKEHHTLARRQLTSSVTLWDVPTEDLWCRDSGPITLVDRQGNRALADIRFNGWGNKQIHRNDGQIARTVADHLGLPMHPTGLIGEAGGVEQDGHGLLMAHESSWVNDNRNPSLGHDDIGNRLLTAYGADQILWAPGVWGEDITDYHIDSLARSTGPGRVLMNLPDQVDPDDPFHLAGIETHDALRAAGLKIDVIPEPNRRRVNSEEFVASYVNYYVCNGAVVAPQFGDRDTDANAVAALKRHYPGREIVTLNTDRLGEIGGGIHCATHEFPAV